MQKKALYRLGFLLIFKSINHLIGPYIENLVKSWLECMKNMQAIFNGYWTRFFPPLDFWQRHHPSVEYSNSPNKRKTKSSVLSTKLSFQYWLNTPKPLLKIGSVNKAGVFWYWSQFTRGLTHIFLWIKLFCFSKNRYQHLFEKKIVNPHKVSIQSDNR